MNNKKRKVNSGKSILKDKSYAFAIAIVKNVQAIQIERKVFVFTKQIFRPITSIGAFSVISEKQILNNLNALKMLITSINPSKLS